MITNEREYRITKSAIASFERAIDAFDLFSLVKKGIDPVLAKAQLSSYEYQLKELTRRVQEYEALRSGAERQFGVSSIREIGRRLISARVAKGWTQRQLAEELGLKEQQIQRYEREKYENTSLKRISIVAGALGAELEGALLFSAAASGSKILSDTGLWQAIDPTLFPIKEMNSRGWFGEEKLDVGDVSSAPVRRALYTFLTDSEFDINRAALHRRTTSLATAKTDAALMAWQARVLMSAKKQRDNVSPFHSLDTDFVRELVSMSRREDGPAVAVSMLRRCGIIVIFERHLSQTYLDGAAMALGSRHAVVGMSLRHDRIDNFWYVLLHELGHIAKHWAQLLRSTFVDEDINDLTSAYEIEADEFAKNSIIPEARWASSFVQYTKSPDEVVDFAARLNISPALVAGRLRRDRQDYRVFSRLVGQGKVREGLQKAGLYQGEGS
jgi:HTH-type transcriptional regulator/antitoxin HigA